MTAAEVKYCAPVVPSLGFAHGAFITVSTKYGDPRLGLLGSETGNVTRSLPKASLVISAAVLALWKRRRTTRDASSYIGSIDALFWVMPKPRALLRVKYRACMLVGQLRECSARQNTGGSSPKDQTTQRLPPL